MSSPEKLRQRALQDAEAFLHGYMEVAMGRGVMTCTDRKVTDNVWELLSGIISRAGDPMEIKGLSDGTIAERVDKVLVQVAAGELTIDQGKRVMEMLQAGFDIQDLALIVEKLNELEAPKRRA